MSIIPQDLKINRDIIKEKASEKGPAIRHEGVYQVLVTKQSVEVSKNSGFVHAVLDLVPLREENDASSAASDYRISRFYLLLPMVGDNPRDGKTQRPLEGEELAKVLNTRAFRAMRELRAFLGEDVIPAWPGKSGSKEQKDAVLDATFDACERLVSEPNFLVNEGAAAYARIEMEPGFKDPSVKFATVRGVFGNLQDGAKLVPAEDWDKDVVIPKA